MVDRQRRRFAWFRITWLRVWIGTLALATAAAGWFLHVHNHLDIRSALVVVIWVLLMFGTAATAVLHHAITVNRNVIREVVSNVVPIRPRWNEDTEVWPAVGRAVPPKVVPRGNAGNTLRPRLAYSAGDNTIDVYLRDMFREDRDTG